MIEDEFSKDFRSVGSIAQLALKNKETNKKSKAILETSQNKQKYLKVVKSLLNFSFDKS